MIQKIRIQSLFKPLHPSWHFYAVIWGIIIGVVLSVVFNIAYSWEWFWLFIVACLLFFIFHFSSFFTLILAVLSGFIIANWRASPELLDQKVWQQLVGQTLTLTGKIDNDPDFSSQGTTLQLSDLCIWPPGDLAHDKTANNQLAKQNCLRGTLYVKLANQPELARSDYLTLQGKLSAGFGTFVGNFFRPNLISIDKIEFGDVFYQFKTSFANAINQFMPSPQSDLGLGYLMGMKSGLSESFAEALQITGMTHVVVASGAHLAILSNAIKKLFGRISKFAGTLFGIMAILAFALVVGFTPSMTRAALVAILSLLVGYVGRKFTPLRLLSFVGAITLLLNPLNFLNLGWQLSFASFFGILIFAPALQKTLYGGKKPPWLASMLITSFSTSLICAPILVCNFGTISLLSFVANLIILPTLPYAMLLVMLTGATSLFPFLATFFAQLATMLLNLHIWLINFLSEKTIFVINLSEVGFKAFLLYIPVLFFLVLPHLRRCCKKLSSRRHQKNISVQLESVSDG